MLAPISSSGKAGESRHLLDYLTLLVLVRIKHKVLARIKELLGETEYL